MPFSQCLPATDFSSSTHVAEAGPSSSRPAVISTCRYGAKAYSLERLPIKGLPNLVPGLLPWKGRTSSRKLVIEREFTLHAKHGGRQVRHRAKPVVCAYSADMGLSDTQMYMPVLEDSNEKSLLLGHPNAFYTPPHPEVLDPFSQVLYQHSMGKNLHWWRFLAYCRAQLNNTLLTNQTNRQFSLVGKEYTKVLLPTKFSSEALSVPAIAVPLKRDPASTALDHINVATSEFFGWFAQMGNRYGASLLCLLVLGYWVQGFRMFPWLAMSFYLKDGLRVNPATLQLCLATANLPMVAKPAYGIISDVIYIGGNRRMPYLMFACALQVMAWSAVVLHSGIRSAVLPLMGVLILGNVGAAIAEVMNDALVAESTQKEVGRAKGELQSFVWLALAAGGILGNLTGGYCLSRVSPTSMFAVFATLVAGHLAVSTMVKESTFNFKSQKPLASKDSSTGSSALKVLRLQVGKLMDLVRKPEIAMPLAWFAASYAIIPAMGGTLFYFQTQHLKIHPTYLGLAKVVGQIGLLTASLLYNRFWKQVSPRKVLTAVQIVLFACTLTDVLMVTRLSAKIGIPDHLFVLGFSSFVEAIGQFKILPFTVLLTQLCPPGSEGSLLAFFMSCHCLALIMSGYVGTIVGSFLNLSATNFSALPLGITLMAFAALLPLLCISCIPGATNEKMAVI